jgi:proton-translocating NAD(P)+ transhydrogenase subunit alpha
VRIVVPKEVSEGEARVALTPSAAGKLVSQGNQVSVQAGAGGHAFPDHLYKDAKAEVAKSVYADAGVVVKVRAPTTAELKQIREGATLIAFLQPLTSPELVKGLAARKILSFSLDAIPRITRAQSLDALSSQATVAGYKAALIAADSIGKLFPMLMTAAGTVTPARVLVLGAGVAGLQAIATCRRLGAVVEAYDVRAAAAEEVRSLGARFVELPLESQEGAGGYAREQSEDFLRRQRELLGEHCAQSDVVITTALVPGRKAPVLVTREMVEGMKPGSVVIDIAAETGGNVELTKPGEVVDHRGVAIHGVVNAAGMVPAVASELYAKNITNLLALISKDGELAPDFSDEVVAGCCITRDGEVVHEATKKAMGASTAA